MSYTPLLAQVARHKGRWMLGIAQTNAGTRELRCIGATLMSTVRYIEKMLLGRFQQVFVAQPTVETTISILRGLKQRYGASQC